MFLFSYDYEEEEEEDNLDLGEKIGVILMCLFHQHAHGGLRLKKKGVVVRNFYRTKKKNARRDTTTTRKNINSIFVSRFFNSLFARMRAPTVC